jgi:hypothetical protein
MRLHMGDIKHIRTVQLAVRVLVPKFDFMEDRDHKKRDCNFGGSVVEVFLQS